ncbi:MAG: SGNH/GDSL hydrolase family protein [Gallintestinimicrobium sp.]|uniref:SGNH/GDSL hydrolase family protein n=1 Tax=Gallintestinimicrobium sp. TaxID=2981655 RepID=UPI0039A73488
MEKRVKIRKTVFGGAIARICCLALCLCLGLSISMTAQAASGKKVTPVTMAAVVGEEKTVTQQADKTSAALGILPVGTTVNVCGQTGSGKSGMYQIVYGNAIGYITQTACQPVCVDVAMTAALAAQAEAVKQQVAQAQAAAALAAQQAAVQQAAVQQAAVQQAAVQQAAVQQAALAQAQAEQKAPIPAGSGNVIFVGDSRTGQMANAVGGTAAWPGTAFVACFGGGVDWLSTAQAKKDVDQYVTPGSVIILNYGVNDLSRHNDYITTINRYAQDWISKGATVYFASVGPVGENEYGKRNWAVEYFNNQLNNRLDARIGRLNLYVFLTGSGYTTQADGLHYDGATYAAMFQFLMQSIGRI